MSVEQNIAGNGKFLTPSYCKSLKFFGTSIASLDPETVQLPAFSILSAMFTGACGPPEKLTLALVRRSNGEWHDGMWLLNNTRDKMK